MLKAIRNVTFTVNEQGIEPTTPQWAGIQAEHNATAVTFVLPDAWLSHNFRYRVEWVDGMQSFFTGDWLQLQGNTVQCLLPEGWTAAGGVGEIRVVGFYQGDDVADSQTVYSAAGKLTFTARDVSSSGVVGSENALSFLLDEVERALAGIQNTVHCTLEDMQGEVVLNGIFGLQYGYCHMTASSHQTIRLSKSFSPAPLVLAWSDKGIVPILSRSANYFEIQSDEQQVFWLAFGQLEPKEE